MTHRDSFLASPCVPSPVSAIRTLKLPLLPLWEKGVGGMRGKGARECKTSLISPKNSTLESRGMKGQRVLRITLPITLEPAWHQSRTIPVITENHAHPGCAGVPNREPRTENREPRAPWERGRPEPRTKNQELRTTCILGARASSPACGDCGLKPSLSTWKPLRGYGGERPWERGRPEPRTKNREPRTTCILGARASRTENQEPRTENHVPPGSAGVPNREPRTENREPRAPWERGRPEPRTKNREPRTTCPLGARASRTENQEPRTENHVHPGCAGVSPACGDCGLMEIEHSIRYALLLWG
jgi:hypothetical protein